MLVSYTWLQRFFDDPLPVPEALAEKLTFGAFEIEGIEKKGDLPAPQSETARQAGDTVIDVKVLPDRACYALSHRGIAREIATLCELPMKDPLRERPPQFDPLTEDISVAVRDAERCPFYAAALIKGVKVGPSPAWLKEHLESIGQKSINNIVDATNFVMFDLGTPLHAFDADRLSGRIGVRAAKAGETITLLGGTEKTLTEDMTVIVDDEADMPIAIAGVKGGTYAELKDSTMNIIIEAAKFDPIRTRKTAVALSLKTDASKRFENNIAAEMPMYGIEVVVELIMEVAGGDLIGYATTALPYKLPYKLGVSTEEVNRVLGTQLAESDITALLERQGFVFEKIEDPRAYALTVAREQLGKPYKLGASITREAPHVFDCSSLVAYAYACAGVPIPRVSVDQYLWTEPVAKADLKVGDLIFFNTKNQDVSVWYESVDFIRGAKVPEGVSHVAMYAGDGMCIHARKSAGAVLKEPLEEVESRSKVVGYRRVNSATPRINVAVPFERLDLRIPQDMIEEVGRVYGYSNIKAEELPPADEKPNLNPRWVASEAVRKTLGELGFSEVYTYTLRDDGEVRLANALATDKSTLRGSLSPGLVEALAKNEYNAPLLGIDAVKIFEIGNVFAGEGESLHVAIAVRPLTPKKRAERANEALIDAKAAIEKEFDVSIDHRISDEVLECELPTYRDLRNPDMPLVAEGVQYQTLSIYPFVLRDIALWVSEGTVADEVRALIIEQSGETLIRVDQFDEFTKDGRTSYAFHLVFQSAEKNLSDTEVNVIMDVVQSAIKGRSWEVR